MTKEKVFKNDDSAKENKPSESLLQGLFFKQVDKPKNLVKIKITNVFDNRYRINVWTETFEDGLTKYKITQSYFARFSENCLILDAQEQPKKKFSF
jgi:hypothetical protein